MVKTVKVGRHYRKGVLVESHERVVDEHDDLTKEIKRKREDERQRNVLFPEEK